MGHGNTFWARGFRDEFKVPVPILVDADKQVYAALELRRGLLTALNLGTVRAAQRAMAAGFRQTKTLGDAWQHGGVFVVRPDGSLALGYASQFAGDHPPESDILAALEQ